MFHEIRRSVGGENHRYRPPTVISQLELEDSIASDFGQLSLNALAGTDVGEAMKIKALVHNKVMLTLIDSGSSHSFVSSAFLHKIGPYSYSYHTQAGEVAQWGHSQILSHGT
jgi:hypothetical protein